MAPKKKMTAVEIKERKRELARIRREKIKSDPILAAIEVEKERMKYERRKAKKQVKLVKDMTPKELSAARKAWREKFRKYYEKRKTEGGFVGSIGLITPVVVIGQKKVRRDKAKAACDEKLKAENAALKRTNNTWRQRYFREKKKRMELEAQVGVGPCSESPINDEANTMEEEDSEEVKKRILFEEVLHMKEVRKNIPPEIKLEENVEDWGKV